MIRLRVLLAIPLVLSMTTSLSVATTGQEPSPAVEASPDAASAPLVVAAPALDEVVPFVPVRRFWSAQRDISLEEVRAAIEGRSEDIRHVVIASDDPAGLWAALEVTPGQGTTTVETVHAVKQAVDHSGRTLGLVPAAKVRPDTRALSVDGLSLFGGERLDDLAAWPLLTVDAGDGQGFDPHAVWTMVAGGDVMLDREPYRKAVIEGKGADWLWDGGYAEITSRTCCTKDGGPAISTRRVGPKGAVRELLSGADIAVVNHEAPAPDDHSYHPSGLIFTVDPDLLPGLVGAGIDAVSLANNHIRNAGSKGVRQTLRNAREAGLRTFGAGADEERARRPWCTDQGQARVCLLGYNEVNAVVHAVTDTRAGAAELVSADVKRDIRQLRREGADVVVVWPHWGREYVTTTEARQRRWAREMIRAGADVVLGNHSHVVGPIRFIDGAPVLYSMGDLVFDLPRFEATEEGVIVELTFHGPELAQVELHPTVIVDRSQLHLLHRDGDGEVVIKRMRRASKKLE